MKRLSRLLNEVKGEKAHREAVSMGLKYKGFGYWQDPSTGKVAYKTENDQLVKVEPDVESELGDMSNKPGAPDPNDGAVADMATSNQMQQPEMPAPPPVGSQVLGAPEPGEELVPSTLEWEPGPDGSTCVDSDEPPGKIPEDSYVSRTNNLKWGAGPDGTNYSNIDYRDLLKDLRAPNLDSFLNRMDTQGMMGRLKEGQTFVSQFLEQAPMDAGMGTRSAADEAKQAGLSYSGYGYWKDNTGQVVAQTVDNKLQYIDQQMGTGTSATTDMGNPTSTASGQTPASKARSMGLVSDGSGSYKDAEGNTIARTVNNELVFYDSRAGGGAVSDGSGGAMITQSSPSWVDPVTGLIVVPPAQPESPEEINAVPDAVPATAPAGYDAFVNKKKKEMYRDNYIQSQVQQDVDAQQAEIDEIYNSSPGLAQFKQEIDEIIQGALDSGDDKKEEIGQLAQQVLEDEAQQFQSDLELLDDDAKAEYIYNMLPYVLSKAKSDYVANRLAELDAEEMDAEERADAESILFAENPDIDYGTARMANQRLVDDAIGVQEDANDGQPEFINGEQTSYQLQYKKELSDDKGFNRKLRSQAKKEGRKFGASPGAVVDITWETNDTAPQDSASRRAMALDALKTWRTQVLPTLEPGTIVKNDPQYGGREDNQRERIYSLAGFGDNTLNGQFGMVVDDNGKLRVIPLDVTSKSKSADRRKKLKEELLYLLQYDLTEQQQYQLYERLFG